MTVTDLPRIGIVPRTRKSPFYEATVQWGARGFTIYNHMLMPIFYESPEADYWRLMNDVTVWDVACERQVEITGPDAFYLARLMTSRNLSRCQIGQCKYIPLVAADGGLINDPVLLRLGPNHFWLSLADSDVLLWARGLAQGLGLDVDIQEPDVSPLAIQGPKAGIVATRLLGEWVKELRFFWFREFDLEGIPLLVARSGWSKQGGFELYLRDGRFGQQLWEMVMAAGRDLAIAPGTPSTIERIESGLLSYGNDMTLANNPFEVGLGKYCDLDQDFDFIGKAALQRIRAAGLTQQLVGLTLSAEQKLANEQFWPIQAGAEVVGHVTSAVYSPRLQKNIALALLAVEFAGNGTNLTVAAPVGPVPAVVCEVPFQ